MRILLIALLMLGLCGNCYGENLGQSTVGEEYIAVTYIHQAVRIEFCELNDSRTLKGHIEQTAKGEIEAFLPPITSIEDLKLVHRMIKEFLVEIE